MEAPAPTAGGLLGSVRGLADSLLEGARQRLDLLAIELHEEKYRLIQVLIGISAAAFAAMLAVTFASLLIVVLFWDSARVAVLAGFAVLYTTAFFLILRYCRTLIRRQPKPFQATLSELQQDRACIRPQS